MVFPGRVIQICRISKFLHFKSQKAIIKVNSTYPSILFFIFGIKLDLIKELLWLNGLGIGFVIIIFLILFTNDEVRSNPVSSVVLEPLGFVWLFGSRSDEHIFIWIISGLHLRSTFHLLQWSLLLWLLVVRLRLVDKVNVTSWWFDRFDSSHPKLISYGRNLG